MIIKNANSTIKILFLFCQFKYFLYLCTQFVSNIQKMKTNFNIFILLFVCLLVGSMWSVLHMSMDENSSAHNPSNITDLLGEQSEDQSLNGSPFTNATLSGGQSNSGAWSLGGLRGSTMSFSSRANRAPLVSYARNASSQTSSLPSGSTAASPISHFTSAGEYHSFGGGVMTGGNYASSSGLIASSPSNLITSSPIAYSSLPIANRPVSSSQGSMGEVMPVADQSFSVASASYTSPFAADYAFNSYGTASYGGYSSPNRIGGRQNAPGSGLGNTWLNWLDNYFGASTTFDYDSALAAYNEMIASWNAGMGVPPSFDDFLAWLIAGGEGGYTKNDHTYNYVPVGGILPLFLMALIYAIILFVKRNKTAQL